MTSTVDKEKLAKAYTWLNNALRYEAEGKHDIVDRALKRACDLENEAFAN